MMKSLRRATRSLAALAVAMAAATSASAAAKLSGDPVAGSKVFARCVACHGTDGQGGPIAPDLRGVYGRKAGSTAFTHYSGKMKASGVTWTAANLDPFLASPSKVIPGTGMMAAVASPQDRQNLIAYLATLKRP